MRTKKTGWTDAQLAEIRPGVTSRLAGGPGPICPECGRTLHVDPATSVYGGPRSARVTCPGCERSTKFPGV